MGSFLYRLRHLGEPALVPPVIACEHRSPRLRLRPYWMTDADDWLAIENDETVREGLGWPTRTPAEAMEHLRARTRHTVLRYSGDLLVLAIEHEGRVIGDVSLHLRTVAPATRSLEIGWLLHSAFGAHGFATEAAEGMLDVAFERAKASLVTAVVSGGNEASAQLALRLGFRLASRKDDQTTYLLAREDYLQMQSRSDKVACNGGGNDSSGGISRGERKAG